MAGLHGQIMPVGRGHLTGEGRVRGSLAWKRAVAQAASQPGDVAPGTNCLVTSALCPGLAPPMGPAQPWLVWSQWPRGEKGKGRIRRAAHLPGEERGMEKVSGAQDPASDGLRFGQWSELGIKTHV